MFCPNCGHKTEEGMSFCANCGHSLQNNAAAAAQQPSQGAPVQPETPPIPYYMPPQQASYYQQKNEVPEGNPAFGIISLITGILSFLIGYIPIIPILLELPAIILGIIGIKKNGGKGMGITGLVLGSIALLTTILITVVFIFAVAASEMIIEQDMMF